MDSVLAVVEENTAVTEEMGTSSSDVSEAMQNITRINEENNLAVEKVNENIAGMNSQVKKITSSSQILSEMAVILQKKVAQFRY
jgi:methyl-accepting chemotaxis protein